MSATLCLQNLHMWGSLQQPVSNEPSLKNQVAALEIFWKPAIGLAVCGILQQFGSTI